jgi:hypothetical protein
MIDLLDSWIMEYYERDRKPFIEYKGEGKLVIEDQIELVCEFKAKQFTDGDIVLICNILPISFHNIIIEKWKNDPIWANCLKGRTKNDQLFEAINVNIGQRLIQDDPLIVCVIFEPKELRIGEIGDMPIDSISFGITNFLFKGIPDKIPGYTEYIDFNLSGKKASLWKVQDYDKISNLLKIRAMQHITCELWADVANWDDIKTMEEKVHELCYILSAGSGSKVQWIFYNVHAKNSLVYSCHILVPNKPFNSQIIIDAEKDIKNWADFITVAYPSFLDNASRFGVINSIPRIMAAIDVFTDARIPMDYIQTKGIKLAVTMEMIKEMFKEAWMPEKRILSSGKWRKMEDATKGALEPILKQYLPNEDAEDFIGRIYQLNRVSFGAILKKGFEMIKFVPDQEDLELFIYNRDSLVHQGRFYSETAVDHQKEKCPPLGSPGEDYAFVSNFLNKVFLALLGYTGPRSETFIIKPSYIN